MSTCSEGGLQWYYSGVLRDSSLGCYSVRWLFGSVLDSPLLAWINRLWSTVANDEVYCAPTYAWTSASPKTAYSRTFSSKRPPNNRVLEP